MQSLCLNVEFLSDIGEEIELKESEDDVFKTAEELGIDLRGDATVGQVPAEPGPENAEPFDTEEEEPDEGDDEEPNFDEIAEPEFEEEL
jgi:hypothetical protein